MTCLDAGPDGASTVARTAERAGRRPLVAGVAAGAVTFAAYLPGLGRSLDFDSAETIGLFVRPGPPWAAFQRQAVFNNHPMFSFLEQLVRVATGRTDAATMRLLPILFGAVGVAVLTWFAARRYGVLAGLVGGSVLACNPTFVTLSRATRGYSLLTLCAVVSTVLVVEDREGRSRRWDVAYVVVAGAGLATHLYMVPVLVAHVAVVLARRGLDVRWRARVLGVVVLGGLAYAGMAPAMVDAGAAHARVFKAGFPWSVALMATGGGWASLAVAPVAIAGATRVLRRRTVRVAALATIAVLALLWAGLQSSALSERFLVWLVPAVGWLVAAAIGGDGARSTNAGRRATAWSLLATAGATMAAVSVLPGYTSDPTGYRRAAALIRQVDGRGERACVVGVGVPPMAGYLDTPRQFAIVTDPAELDACDVVVVAAWWHSSKPWLAADEQVMAAAENTFPYRRVIPAADPTLVLSTRPL